MNIVIINVILILVVITVFFVLTRKMKTVISEIEDALEQSKRRFSLSAVRKGVFEGVAFTYTVAVLKNGYGITLKVPCNAGVVFYIEKGTFLGRLFGVNDEKILEMTPEQRILISHRGISEILSDLLRSSHFNSLEINGKEAVLRLSFKKSEGFKNLRSLLSALIELKKRIESISSDVLVTNVSERKQDLTSHFLWGFPLVLAGILLGSSILIMVMTGKNFEIIEPLYFPKLIVYFIVPPYLCYVIVAFKRLKERPLGIKTFRKVLVTVFICAVSSIPAIIAFNGFFDRSKPLQLDAIVEGKNFRPKERSYSVKVRFISPVPPCLNKGNVSRITVNISHSKAKDIIPYHTQLRLFVKRGTLGFCWLDSFKIIERTER